MLDKLIALDKKLFVFLYELGSEKYDFLWLKITKQINWFPFFLVILYLLIKKISWKQMLVVVLFLALLITCTDQTANLFKNGFQRLRPCNDFELKSIIRNIGQFSSTYSFFSGHAANSMATMTFVFLILRNFYTKPYWLFIFPLVFAYSRIYLGLHFPLDIITGYSVGFLYGYLFYKLYKIFLKNQSLFYPC